MTINFIIAVLYIFLNISITICVKEKPKYNKAGGQIESNIIYNNNNKL